METELESQRMGEHNRKRGRGIFFQVHVCRLYHSLVMLAQNALNSICSCQHNLKMACASFMLEPSSSVRILQYIASRNLSLNHICCDNNFTRKAIPPFRLRAHALRLPVAKL
jgi:hypothetical protein